MRHCFSIGMPINKISALASEGNPFSTSSVFYLNNNRQELKIRFSNRKNNLSIFLIGRNHIFNIYSKLFLNKKLNPSCYGH
jgi:hypothetical protein